MLTGKRVTLRAMRRDDLTRLREFSNDVEAELLGGGNPPAPFNIEQIEAWFNENLTKERRDNVTFAIEADGKFIGTCGIWRFDPVSRTCELGIGIGDHGYWGRGYGREAIGLLLRYAFQTRNFRRVWLTTVSNNERAIRCYLACGFVEEGRLRAHDWSDGVYVDKVYMGLLSEEWRERV